jgi:DNA segregation ATPase FtsK/SpoIIIE-like protein
MVFDKQELRKIIQAPISVDMKIDLLNQLHHQDAQKTVSEMQQSILEAIEKVLSSERVKGNTMLDSEHADQFLPDALAFSKKKELTVQSLQRTFKIGYNRANQLLAQCKRVMNEEEE